MRRVAGARRDGRSARSVASGGSDVIPTDLIPGLVADFDLSSPNYLDYLTLNGNQVALWVPRAGDLVGAGGLAQGTSGNRPTLASNVSVMNGQRALLFDGTDDYLQWSGSASDWTFLHDGSGGTAILVYRMDSTGGENQGVFSTANNGNTLRGVYESHTTTSALYRVSNGSGVAYVNNWQITSAVEPSLVARDVSIWRAISYETGTRRVRASGGVNLARSDEVGQTPSPAAPSASLRVGTSQVGITHMKGYIARVIIYRRVLTDDEINDVIAPYLADTYGVAA